MPSFGASFTGTPLTSNSVYQASTSGTKRWMSPPTSQSPACSDR